MNNLIIALDGAWKVLLAGLLLGAGIPTLFAMAVKSGDGRGGEAAGGAPSRAAGKLTAAVFFFIILTLVVYGLAWLIFTSLGFKVGFSGPFPDVLEVRFHH